MAHDPFWAGRRVCVTGGTGFLGYHLVVKLVERGASVRVLALPPRPDHPIRHSSGIELIEGDIRDLRMVRRAVDRCDVVFHTAGIVGVWGPALERMWSVHVDGTKNVIEAVGRGVRLVHTSSIMAVGASRRGEVLDEQNPFNLGDIKLPYCHAKRASEELALASGLDVVVTNPGYLIGPEDHEPSGMGRFCMRVWKGRLPVAPTGGINLVDVRDAAAGHLLAAEHGRSGERYILGCENRTFSVLMTELASVAGYTPRVLPRMPTWALAAAAGVTECRAWFTGREPYPSMAHARLNRFHWFYRADKARDELGFRCMPFAETLQETHRWFRDRISLEPRGLVNRWLLRRQRAA